MSSRHQMKALGLLLQALLFLQATCPCSSRTVVRSVTRVSFDEESLRRRQQEVPSNTLDVLTGRKEPPAAVQLSSMVSENLAPQPTADNDENSSEHWSTPSFLAGMACGVLFSLLTIPVLLYRSADGKAAAASQSLTDARSPEGASTGASVEEDAAPGPDRNSPLSESQSEFGSVENLHLFWPRCFWLATMLMLQSVSSLILSNFQHLIQRHDDLIFYLTMLVGLGGNAGGQSVVLTCRKLALNQSIEIRQQLQVGLLLGLVLGPLAFLRSLVTGSDARVGMTIGLSALCIATIATGVGTTLPKLLYRARQDPGQAASMIQVIMDITGIMITCLLGASILS